MKAATSGDAPAARAGGHRPRLVAYALLGIGAAGLFWRALLLPSSRWEPLGAGTFPAIVLGLLTGLCVVGLIAEAVARAEPGAGPAAWLRSHRLVIFTFVAFACYVAILPLLGFGLATFAFLLVVQLHLAPATMRIRALALAIAAVFSFGLEWLFAEAFNIFLPRARLLE